VEGKLSMNEAIAVMGLVGSFVFAFIGGICLEQYINTGHFRNAVLCILFVLAALLSAAKPLSVLSNKGYPCGEAQEPRIPTLRGSQDEDKLPSA
jgi:hypothetical protein